jgi:hemolysin activation/secretion protein
MAELILGAEMRRSNHCRTALLTAVYLACTATPLGSAAAQQANPAQLAPRLQPAPSAGVSIGAAPIEPIVAPAHADQVFVTVRRVTIDGAFPELAEQTAALVAQIEGQRVSVARIYEVAKALDAAYTSAYPLARIKVPPQDFRSGVVRFAVTDGFIERADLDAVPERARAMVIGRLEPLINKQHLTRTEIERRILLLGDIAGLVGSSSAKLGSTPGGYVLIVQATDKVATAAEVVDNRLSRQIGTWRFTQSAAVNNALGFGEQVYATAASSSDFNRFFDGRAKFLAYGGGVTLPIGFDGLKAEAGYVQVRQTPTPLWGAFPIEEVIVGERAASRYERAYVNALYPVILTTEQTLRVQATFDYIEERLRSGPAPLGFALPVGWVYDGYRDRYGAIRFAAEWGFQFPWAWGGKAVTSAIYSHGLGGRTAWDAPLVGSPLSRQGSGPVFDKLYANMRIIQPLPDGFQALFIARGQTGFGSSLMLAEQFSIDGDYANSGFAAGTINVDRGITLRGELSRPFDLNLGFVQGNVSPYIFGAWGRGVREWPFIGEVKWVEAETFGAGLRTGTAITGLPAGQSLSVEFARGLSNLPFRQQEYRTNFTFLVKF